MRRFLRVCLFVVQLLVVLVLARYVDDLGWGIYLLVAAGSCAVLFLVLGYPGRRLVRAAGERAAPTIAPTRGHTEDQLRRQLLARLAFDMRAPIATAARAVAALRDKPPAPPSTLSPPTEDDGIDWAP